MKMKHLYIAVLTLGFGFLALTAFQNNQGSANYDVAVKKKIKFNHKLHKDAAECTACHSGISASTSLSGGLFPKKEDCASCHDVSDQKNCTQCHFENTFEKLQPASYDLYFNHEAHLKADKDCNKCHSGISEDDGTTSMKYTPKMESCYTCHGTEKGGSTACEACHKNTSDLTPKSHKVTDYKRFHKFAAEAPGANCNMCHDDASCEECHTGTTGITERNKKGDFYMPYATAQNGSGIKQQRLTRVHEIGYRFTHGVEASSKTKECTTCHQTETFCAQCHSGSSQDYAQGGILPSSHKKAGFLFISVGSGGGEHATLARRDIEKCASCHDVQGGDPTCIMCHTDNVGIRGHNPKTHKSGFMRDVHGDWHSTSSSVCYNCHTDPTARPSGTPGIGFCGYCHGQKR
ncbi:MAG: cytochrome c3 family protein [Ignavibacteria bacterium]|nr:cytochrome c3 family protein [Ignavibacteria bacterium]